MPYPNPAIIPGFLPGEPLPENEDLQPGQKPRFGQRDPDFQRWNAKYSRRADPCTRRHLDHLPAAEDLDVIARSIPAS
jgi:hypothetical protein